MSLTIPDNHLYKFVFGVIRRLEEDMKLDYDHSTQDTVKEIGLPPVNMTNPVHQFRRRTLNPAFLFRIQILCIMSRIDVHMMFYGVLIMDYRLSLMIFTTPIVILSFANVGYDGATPRQVADRLEGFRRAIGSEAAIEITANADVLRIAHHLANVVDGIQHHRLARLIGRLAGHHLPRRQHGHAAVENDIGIAARPPTDGDNHGVRRLLPDQCRRHLDAGPDRHVELADPCFQPVDRQRQTLAPGCRSRQPHRAARLVENGEPEARRFSSMAKLEASEAAMQVTREAVQVFGGYGYVREYPVERLFRDAKVTEIYEGTSEIHRSIIGKQLFRERGLET